MVTPLPGNIPTDPQASGLPHPKAATSTSPFPTPVGLNTTTPQIKLNPSNVSDHSPNGDLAEKTTVISIKNNVIPVDKITLTRDNTSDEKGGNLIDCIGWRASPNEGRFFFFKFKDQFNIINPQGSRKEIEKAVKEKTDEIFPAVEPQDKLELKTIFIKKLQSFGYIFFNDSKKPSYFSTSDSIHSTQDNMYFCLPDEKAIAETLKKYPGVTPIKILHCDEIISPLKFIETLCKYDIVLSSGKEFIHDSIFHLAPALQAKLEGVYDERKQRLNEVATFGLEKIKAADGHIDEAKISKVTYALGFLVDYASSVINEEEEFGIISSDHPPAQALLEAFSRLEGMFSNWEESDTPKRMSDAMAGVPALWKQIAGDSLSNNKSV